MPINCSQQLFLGGFCVCGLVKQQEDCQRPKHNQTAKHSRLFLHSSRARSAAKRSRIVRKLDGRWLFCSVGPVYILQPIGPLARTHSGLRVSPPLLPSSKKHQEVESFFRFNWSDTNTVYCLSIYECVRGGVNKFCHV